MPHVWIERHGDVEPVFDLRCVHRLHDGARQGPVHVSAVGVGTVMIADGAPVVDLQHQDDVLARERHPEPRHEHRVVHAEAELAVAGGQRRGESESQRKAALACAIDRAARIERHVAELRAGFTVAHQPIAGDRAGHGEPRMLIGERGVQALVFTLTKAIAVAREDRPDARSHDRRIDACCPYASQLPPCGSSGPRPGPRTGRRRASSKQESEAKRAWASADLVQNPARATWRIVARQVWISGREGRTSRRRLFRART